MKKNDPFSPKERAQRKEIENLKQKHTAALANIGELLNQREDCRTTMIKLMMIVKRYADHKHYCETRHTKHGICNCVFHHDQFIAFQCAADLGAILPDKEEVPL